MMDCRVMVVLGLLVLSCGSCAVRSPESASPYQRYEYTRPEMGLPWRILCYTTNRAQAQLATRRALDRVKALNAIFSDYETDSELSRLSQTAGSGRAVPVSAELWQVMDRSRQLHDQTSGAFDVTVGPSVGVWRRARREKKLPAPHHLTNALARVGTDLMVFEASRKTITLTKPYMLLDLGGIAKGYALDEALRIMKEEGIDRAMISGGGDMVMGKAPPGKAGWRIEVGSVDKATESDTVAVELVDAALATSGDLFQYLEIDGVRYSHIVDPRTGLGLTNQVQVTLIARDATTADSLATSLSVLKIERGFQLLEAYPESAAYVLRRAPDGDTVLPPMASKQFGQYQAD